MTKIAENVKRFIIIYSYFIKKFLVSLDINVNISYNSKR